MFKTSNNGNKIRQKFSILSRIWVILIIVKQEYPICPAPYHPQNHFFLKLFNLSLLSSFSKFQAYAFKTTRMAGGGTNWVFLFYIKMTQIFNKMLNFCRIFIAIIRGFKHLNPHFCYHRWAATLCPNISDWCLYFDRGFVHSN